MSLRLNVWAAINSLSMVARVDLGFLILALSKFQQLTDVCSLLDNHNLDCLHKFILISQALRQLCILGLQSMIQLGQDFQLHLKLLSILDAYSCMLVNLLLQRFELISWDRTLVVLPCLWCLKWILGICIFLLHPVQVLVYFIQIYMSVCTWWPKLRG